MIISLPYIDTQRHYPAIMAIYDAKAAEYNAQVAIARDSGDKSRQFLKSAHREVWQDLVRALKGEMAKIMFIFKDRDTQSLIARKAGDSLILMTNRKRLSARTKKSEVTIYRLLERLIDAGMIEQKINHGTQRDFELHLNRSMVPVSDYKNEKFNPLTWILQNSIDATIQETLRSICTPCSSNLNSFNNEIITTNIPEQKVESAPLMLSNEHTGTHYWNTGDPLTPSGCPFASDISKINTSKVGAIIISELGLLAEQNMQSKINTSVEQPIDNYSQKMAAARKKHEERVRNYAIELVEFMIAVLFKDKLIYQAEREKAYTYAQAYFNNYSSSMDCQKALINYRERVRLVERWLEKHPEFDFSNIYPAAYLNPDNTKSGFTNTRIWLKKDIEYRHLQYKQRKLKTAEATVVYAVKRMLRWKNESSFNYWRSYVINKAPQMVEQFEQIAKIELKRASKIN